MKIVAAQNTFRARQHQRITLSFAARMRRLPRAPGPERRVSTRAKLRARQTAKPGKRFPDQLVHHGCVVMPNAYVVWCLRRAAKARAATYPG